MGVLRLAFTALLVSALAGPARPASDEPPTAAPSPSPRPVMDSVERVIDRLEAERINPCLRAARVGLPCFPARADEKGPDASVREGLGILGPAEKPSPDRPPTRDELGPYRPQPEKPAVSKTIDPGCVGKSILKSLRGRNDTYYLYRLRDVNGERVVLYDHRLEAAKFQGEVEFLGRFDGECDALAAYQRERSRTAAPPPPSP